MEVGELQNHQTGTESNTLVEASLYEIEATAQAKYWADIRKELLFAHTEEASFPETSLCIVCAQIAELRCKQCGPHVFFCKSCFQQQHCSINIFHVAEKWLVSKLHCVFNDLICP